jgi:hypothetical protein
VNALWDDIKRAVENGHLGGEAKVSTAKPNPLAKNPEKHVICVYTFDAENVEDVKRIRQVLREMGIAQKLPYKSDDATTAGEYEKAGNRRVSTFYE